MYAKRLTEQQKRVINENPHLSTKKLSLFLGVTVRQIEKLRAKSRNYKFCYPGIGIPFFYFNGATLSRMVIHKGKTIFHGSFDLSLKVLDHLIWCIENNMFNQPRIERPYLENLKFGEFNV